MSLEGFGYRETAADGETDTEDSAGGDLDLSRPVTTRALTAPTEALVDKGVQPGTDASLSARNASSDGAGEVDQDIAKQRSEHAGIDSLTQGASVTAWEVIAGGSVTESPRHDSGGGGGSGSTKFGEEDAKGARKGSDGASIAMEEEDDAEVFTDAGADRSPLEAVVARGALAPERVMRRRLPRLELESEASLFSPIAVWVSLCCSLVLCTVKEWQRRHG